MGTHMDTESHECEDFDSDGCPVGGATAVGEAGRRSVSQLFSAQGKRTHPLEDTGSGDPGRQKVADRTVPEGHRAVRTAAGPVDALAAATAKPVTEEEVAERLLELRNHFEGTILGLCKRVDTLTQANEQLQRDMTRKFAQLQTQHQQQQAGWQEELQGSTQEEIDVTRSHIEQVDRTGRLCNLVVKGIRPPAGGRGALGLHVQDLLVKHAGIPKQSIADVSCIGPIRSAGVKLVRVRLTSVSDKHAAFRASAALRREKVYLDDDLTRAQQATRRRLEPARQRYMSQGMPAWWRGDTLLFRQHGEVHKHDDARRSDQHASQHQSSSPMHASPRHPPAAAVPTVGAARRSDAGGPVNQAPPSGAIAATSPSPGPTLPPPPPNPPVASSSMATHVPRPSYAHATSASPPSGPPSRQRRRPNRA